MGSETNVDYVTEIECSLVVEDQVHDAPEKSCRTVQKPVTKYRQEQECNTRYEQECNTRYEQSCHTVVEKECSYINGHQKCWDEPREKCEQVPKQDCHQVPKQDCHAKSVPYTEYENTEVCTTTTKPVSRPVPVSKY